MNVTSFNDIIKNIPDNAKAIQTKEIGVGLGPEITLDLKTYLPINEKVQLISFVVDNAIDESTGCFSPVRLNVYYSIGVLIYYCGLDIEDINVVETYDLFEKLGIFNAVLSEIPEEERQFMEDLLDNTVEDIARYNHSAAGIIHSMTNDAGNLSDSLQDILAKIKDREGLEVLSEIKNVVGND